MTYEMKPLSCNPAKIEGLSEQLVASHYENNYGGAVKRLNAITARLDLSGFLHRSRIGKRSTGAVRKIFPEKSITDSQSTHGNLEDHSHP